MGDELLGSQREMNQEDNIAATGPEIGDAAAK